MKTRLVRLDDVVAGDTLGADLADPAGHLLLPRGTVLCAATLAGLQRRGIETLTLTAPADADADAADAAAARRAVVERALRQRFRRAGSGGATRLLFAATLEHLVERET